MNIIKVIRKTTSNEDFKRFLDYYIFQHREQTINIAHAKRYLDITDRKFWDIINKLESDFHQYLDFVFTPSPTGGKDTLRITEIEDKSDFPKTPRRGRSESENTRRAYSLSKRYEVTSPTGEVQTIRNLSKFCQEHNLNGGNMSTVAAGKRNHHKGWKAKILPKQETL